MKSKPFLCYSVFLLLLLYQLSVYPSVKGETHSLHQIGKSSKNISKVHQDILGTCSFNAKNYEMNKWLNGLMI